MSNNLYISCGLLLVAASALTGSALSISEKIVPAADQPQGPNLYGTVILSDTEEFDQWGIYSIPTAPGEDFSRIVECAEGFGRGSGVATSSTYTAVRYYTFYGMSYTQAYTYDLKTWEQIGQMKSVPFEMMAYDLGYDPVSEQIYGCFYVQGSETKAWFGTAAYSKGESHKIADIEKWNALAFDMWGHGYAIDMRGNLLSVDKKTGATSQIGFTGVVPRYPTSATIDPESGVMYWTACPEDGHSYLYKVDLSTAKATKVMQFPHDEQVMGLFIPVPEAIDAAPAAPASLDLNFPKGTLNGDIVFTLPEKTFGGSPLSGSLEWSISCEGLDDRSGKGEPGEEISLSYNIAERGEYLFCLTVSNEAGLSPRVRKGMFIGDGVPASTTATLSYSDEKAVVSWEPVTESADGGYIDPEEVTYRVTRLPDNLLICENLKGSEIETPLPEPDSLVTYRFEVVPCFAGLEGVGCFTQTITLGFVTPPYDQKFDSEEDFNTFTVIDSNADGKAWEYWQGYARLFYSDRPSDDWLISPALNLVKDEQYSISFDVRNSYGSFNPERIEVMIGEGPSVEDMNIVLLEPILVDNESWKNISVDFIPRKSGKYWLGIHGISDPNMFWVGIDNLSIKSGRSTSAPAPCAEMKATADMDGGDSVTVSFNAPTHTIAGDALNGISRVELFRDEDSEPLSIFSDVKIGEQISYVDKGLSDGIHTYTAVAWNESGAGAVAVASAFVGINVPGEVENISLKEINEGVASISWNPPTLDRDGFPINPSFISYKLVDIDGEEYETTETSASYQAMAEGYQDFVRFGVIAKTSAGESTIAYSDMVPMGTPYETPYRDSFNDNFGGILGSTKIEGETRWGVGYDGYFDGVNSQDGDDAMILMEATSPGDCGAIYTGKISLKNCKNPSVSLFVYQFIDNGVKDDENTLEIEARIANTEEYRLLKKVVNNTLPLPGWNRVVVSLADFEGEEVQLRFKCTANSYIYYLLDNVIVDYIHQSNLGILSIDSPDSVYPDEEFEIRVTVENSSLTDAEDFSLELLRDDEPVETRRNLALSQGKLMEVVFKCSLPITETRDVRYSVRLSWNKDENAADDEVYVMPIHMVQTNFPKVDELRGNALETGNRIEWDALDMTKFDGETVTEDFEDMTPFSMNPGGDWRFVDLDKAVTAVPQGVEIEGLGDDRAYAFIVMNSDWPGFNGTFGANSGKQYLMASYAAAPNDDWAISPRLSGEAQTISFYAKNYYEAHGKESIEVRYSLSGNDPADFTGVALSKTLEGNDWEYITVELPEGSVYAAIHYVSNDQYMLFVDDFSYIPAPWSERINHIGYNIYRDGLRLNTTPLSTTSYLDSDVEEEMAVYHVTAVYEEGESAPSASFELRRSGISEIEDALRVEGLRGAIHVSGAEGKNISIWSISGLRIVSIGEATENMEIPLEPGIYIVEIAGISKKVIVK